MDNIRDEVKVFARDMEERLQANDHKGGWGNISIQWLWSYLRLETYEVKMAIDKSHPDYPSRNSFHPTKEDTESIIRECADVANYAMMIADKVRKA